MTKTLPWTRLFVEGAIVVASILLALAVDAWWSGRIDEAARQEWLASLEADFATHATEARGYAERSAGDRVFVQRFVLMSAEETAVVPEDSVWAYLSAIWRPNPAPLNTPAIVAALEAAPVLAAQDDELRRAIGRWRTAMSYLERFDTRLWDTQERALSAVLGYPGAQRAFAVEEAEGDASRSLSLSSTLLIRAKADPEMLKLAAQKARYAAQQIRFLRDVATAAEDVRATAAVARMR